MSHEQYKGSAKEDLPERKGIPEIWFHALIKGETLFPEAPFAIECTIAPYFFQSIATQEVTPQQAFNSQVSTEQIEKLRQRANVLHPKFNIEAEEFPLVELPDSAFANLWERSQGTLSYLAAYTLDWKNDINVLRFSRTFVTPCPTADELIQGFEELLAEPAHQEKLANVIELANTAADVLRTPESKVTALERKLLIKQDLHGYKQQFFMAEALQPVYNNIEAVIEQKALELEQEKGIVIPDPLKAWFGQKF